MSSVICSCGSCNKCARRALFHGLCTLRRKDPGLYYEAVRGQLNYLATLEQDFEPSRAFCEAFLKFMLTVEQYEMAQAFVWDFLLPRAIMNSTLVWLVYKAFRADATTRASSRKTLPLRIARRLSALSDSGVSFGDIIELYELPGWTSRFDWVILARNHRGELTRMLEHAPHRLSDHLWTVIKATWILLDADAEKGVQNMRKQDGYGYAKNVSPLDLAVRAIYDFGPIGEAVCTGGV
jgi:hypothetical protein